MNSKNLMISALFLFWAPLAQAQSLSVQEFTPGSGVNPGKAKQVQSILQRELTKQGMAVGGGGQVVVSGKIFVVGDKLNIVAKIKDNRTNKVYGETVSGAISGDLTELVKNLSGKISRNIK